VVVIGPVIVAVHVNGNATVRVIGPVNDDSRVDHLGQHGHHPFEQPNADGIVLVIDQLVDPQDVEMCGGLHR
jgi:hypothetical protein